jgi:hypothetical protein
MGKKKACSIITAPVLLLAFRRPEETRRVFEQIRKARPKKYFLYIDGPRNEEEKKKVDLVKKIASSVDWPCEFKTFFRPKNMGMVYCKEGISWFFEHVEGGIILEDDAVPTPEFFRFCSELLEKYKDDNRIMWINGCNSQRGWIRDREYSYYFSKCVHAKGLATWKRAHKLFDQDMKLYKEFIKKDYLKDVSRDKVERFLLKKSLKDAYYKIPEAVDTRWTFSILVNNGLTIIPNKNLVTDIGFGEGAGHTKEIDSYMSLPSERISFPLNHPQIILPDSVSDTRYFKWKFKNKLKKHFLLKTGICSLINRRRK